MLGFVIFGQQWQLDRYQFAALQGTDDDLLALAVVGNDRRHQVCEHGLQQKGVAYEPSIRLPLLAMRVGRGREWFWEHWDQVLGAVVDANLPG